MVRRKDLPNQAVTGKIKKFGRGNGGKSRANVLSLAKEMPEKNQVTNLQCRQFPNIKKCKAKRGKFGVLQTKRRIKLDDQSLGRKNPRVILRKMNALTRNFDQI